ncbi:MAG: sodium:proton antiporter [Clostridiales Family XIII bacterium]|jgi:Na+/H+ antiporter NhaD/arsenite permease-like protein|nr:sodium:proton antiporter [Clostridiales Family XIII bacterium]
MSKGKRLSENMPPAGRPVRSCVRLAAFVAALALSADCAFASGGEAAEESAHALGSLLPFWSVAPFAGLLLSIAIFPLVKPHWWEKHLFKVSIFWSLLFFVPFAIALGAEPAFFELIEIVLLDYLPFIILLWGLFAVSGGIVLRGDLVGTPKVNLLLLLIGTLLASWVGTTGASMLLIRPLLRANESRKKKAHIVVFFIFLVSNMGGCLTPVGDPPLFLGFLRGVPFFWTMRLLPLLIVNTVVLLAVFFIMDTRLYKKEFQGRDPDGSSAFAAVGAYDGGDAGVPARAAAKSAPLSLAGAHNLLFLAVIVGSVILSGITSTHPSFYDENLGVLFGIPVYDEVILPYNSVLQMALIVLAGIFSIITTKSELRKENLFTWGPIKEVAHLFIGIFITMIPALAILNARGAELGLTSPWQFFWATGALSSFLDNAPTYLVFMTTAGSLGAAEGLSTAAGLIAPKLLLAVSAGAVFMGANTYIGNAPNFMVRSIAEENGIKMPSFFGYIGWSLCFLVPLFLLDTLIFFLN